jgi:hypothetical protein
MKALFTTLPLLVFALTAGAQNPIPNRLINYPAFLADAQRAGVLRESRRLTEDQFIAAMREPGVVLLDARSAAMFKLRHVKSAVNLSLPDFTADALAGIIPAKNSKVLIYCNNNFLRSPVAFASKAPGASLNITSFVNLYTYGYTNVFELGPLLDVKQAKLPFEGDEVAK